MTGVLYDYPKKVEFNRVLPKSKIYEKNKLNSTKLKAALKNKFVSQIEKIEWKYVLAPRAINIKAGKTIKEIAIFEISLKQGELDFDVLRVIDRIIRIPIFYLLAYNNKIKTVAAYKRGSEADSEKWVTEAYFESQWLTADAKREPLPVALDMERLYEKLLRQLMPFPARAGETLQAHVERLTNIQNKQKELDKLQTRLNREKQFNRKVEVNSRLRVLKGELNSLTTENSEEIEGLNI